MKRWIIFLHRYLGIPMSVVFVIWFISGIVMIYTGGMPVLTEADRLARIGAIEFDRIALSPAEAAEIAGFDGDARAVTLTTLLGRPAYRIGRTFGRQSTVFADNGEIFEEADMAEARQAVAVFSERPESAVQFIGTLNQADQWTITEAEHLPLDRYDVDDGRGTRVYFSREAGEVELVTNRMTRALAWAGAIPHWFYFSPLRTNQPLWYWSVVWVAAIACFLAVLGIVLAFTQFRRSKPFRLSASVRYRGWMRWHYYTGAVFGIFSLTWAFSGMMSMEPFPWNDAEGLFLPRNELQGGDLALERYRLDDPFVRQVIASDPVEIELLRIQREPYYSVTTISPDGAVEHRLIDADTLSLREDYFSEESILGELERTVTDANIRDFAVLDAYDAYYYSRDGSAPLPVLRVRFDDPAYTWAYFDLATSAQLGSIHRLSRLQRWLFNGLHSLDFSFWYARRPLWDIGLIVLSLGALASSAIGMYLGMRRLAGRAAK